MRLEKCGFIRVGRIAIKPKFDISFENTEAYWWVCCLYAFKVGNEVLRIGKTERRCLSVRIDQWNSDVKAALQGVTKRGGTPLEEAREWSRYLAKRDGEFWAKQILPRDIASLRKEERKHIRSFCPRFCRDLPRECRPT